MNKRCVDCGSDDLEYFEDMDGGYYDSRCYRCNDELINQSNNIREWQEYHPGVPYPADERDKPR